MQAVKAFFGFWFLVIIVGITIGTWQGQSTPTKPLTTEQKLEQETRKLEENLKRERDMQLANSPANLNWADCMDGDTLNDRAINSIDWSKVKGSANWPKSGKLMVGKAMIYADMHKFGIKPCDDVAPGYNKFIKTGKM